jgi:hypothetical protein
LPPTPTSPARRCIVNVATGHYAELQKGLVRSLASIGYQDGLVTWTDVPEGSPAHAEDPYVFKLYAFLKSLDRGFRTTLWLDAPCVVSRAPGPIFDRIEAEGHLFVTDGSRLGNWASDACLGAFGLSRDEAMELPLLNGSFIGLDLANDRSAAWLSQMSAARLRGLFRGPWLSPHAPAEIRAKRSHRETGFVSSDPRCWGHRHDEAVGSAVALRLGMAISAPGALFGGPESDAVVRSPKA